MAHTQHAHSHVPADAAGRRSTTAAWILFALAGLLLAVSVIFQGEAPAPVAAGQAGPPMIEDWRGNSASITPAP